MNPEITILRKSKGAMTKRISLNEDGGIATDGSACSMATGAAVKRRLNGTPFADLAGAIDICPQNEALALGSFTAGDNEIAIVVKGKENGETSISRSRDYFHFTDAPTAILLDMDVKEAPEHVHARLTNLPDALEIIAEIWPGFDNVGYVARPSTSAYVRRADGTELRGFTGCHVYLIGNDGTDTARFLEALCKQAWLRGYGWIALSKSGALLVRSAFDAVVQSPERLVFEAAPILDETLARNPDLVRPLFREGAFVDTHSLQLTAAEEAEYEQLVGQAKVAIKPQSEATRATFIDTEAAKLVDRDDIDLATARQAVQARADGALSGNDVVLLDDGRTVSVGDLIVDSERFDGVTMPDPVEGPDYGCGKAQYFANADSNTPIVNSFAHGGIVYRLRHSARSLRKAIEAGKIGVIRLYFEAGFSELPESDQIDLIALATGRPVEEILKQRAEAAARGESKSPGAEPPRPLFRPISEPEPLPSRCTGRRAGRRGKSHQRHRPGPGGTVRSVGSRRGCTGGSRPRRRGDIETPQAPVVAVVVVYRQIR